MEHDPKGWSERNREMIVGLSRQGVLHDPQLEQALVEVPRHRFLPDPTIGDAYADKPLSIGPGATISAPHMVVMMLEALGPPRADRCVLELGSGSGWVVALLSWLTRPGGRTVGVELEWSLCRDSRRRLRALGFGQAEFVHASALGAVPLRAQFDDVLVSFALPDATPEHLELVAPGGTLVAPIGQGDVQQLTRYRRTGDGWDVTPMGACRFVPAKGWSRREGA